MSELKKRGAMFQKSPPDYVKDGLVLYLDGEEDFMLMDINGALTRIWRDRVMSSQKVHIGGVTQSQGVTYWDGVTSCARIPQDEYIALLNILSGLKERTIEVVCKLNDTDASQTLILGNGTSSETGFSASGAWDNANMRAPRLARQNYDNRQRKIHCVSAQWRLYRNGVKSRVRQQALRLSGAIFFPT